MMGIVFNLLEAAVCRTYGEARWYQLLDKAGLDGAYTSIGNYPDAEAFRIVGVAAEVLQLPPGEVLRWFGRESMGMVAERYSLFFTDHSSVRTFLPTINRVHNDEVRKLYPGALLPQFSFEDAPADTLRMVYHSSRSLCDLAQGFIEGTALVFKEQITVEHPYCKLRGDHQCRFDIRFRELMPANSPLVQD
ncbi:MAG: heme NO-binding domain-containing protein [Acidobacteriaceae bacterium]|jgi:hypothetical protein|nr:heme NO-binding domain-containing protein [Acidobacteriaceae bacterium]